MPKLNRYNDGGFVYGQWREVGRRVDPVTGDIIITERREGSRDVKYDTRGVSWRKGYEDWLAAGNEGTMEDFKLEAEAWKRSQDRKEFDSQNRERRIKRNQEGEGDDEGKPSDDPRPDDFVGDGPGVGGPGGGGGSGDVSRPDKDDNVRRPRRPGDADTPSVSLLPKRPVSPIYDGDYEQVPLVPFVSRDPTNIAIPASQIAMTPEQMGEVILEEGEGVGEVLPDSRVESEYNLRTDSRTNRRGKEIVKQTYTDNINLLRDDGLSTINTKQVDRSKTGRPTRSRGRSVYQEFDSEGNRIFRDVNRFESGGLVSKNNNRNDMYHNKKEMGMGGRNMPKLMKRGGKTFPDLTGDGKVTRADILAGRGVIGKKKKKSMAIGGMVNPTGDPEKEPSTASRVKEGYSDFFSQIAEAPGDFMNMLREGIDFLSGYDDVEREDRRRLRAVYGSPGSLMSTDQAEWDRVFGPKGQERNRKEAELRNMKFESAARRFNEGNPHPSDPEFSSMLPEAEVVAVDESHGLPTSKLGENIYPMGVNRYAIGSQYGLKPYHGAMGLPSRPYERRAYPMPIIGPRVNENNLEKLPKSLGYGGKVKMLKGGKVEYGLGGAVMGGINALMAGKGLAGAAGAAAKGFVTPGSGIAQGAQLAGNLAQKSNNPMLQNIGKMAGMASNFLPGGNPMGAIGAIGGMFQQKHGGYVSRKHRLF